LNDLTGNLVYLAAAGHSSSAIYHISLFQAIVLGIIQGVFELFPLSSLGHTVLIPSWLGGNWALLVRQESRSESPYLAFIVGLHLANAVALFAFYLKEWGRIIAGFFRSVARRRIQTDSERLAWLIIAATIPVGVIGLAFEHTFRTLFAKPLAAAIFLTVNGLILFAGEWFRRRNLAQEAAAVGPPRESEVEQPPDGGPHPERSGSLLRQFRDERLGALDPESEHEMADRLSGWSAVVIGTSQSLALLAGISREGVSMVGGLYRGLSNEGAMRFAFLLSAPVIFAAGALKVPDLFGPLGNGIRGEVVAGTIAALVASFAAIAFLSRYFKTRTLVPFAIYSLAFGAASVIRFGLF
jgi:undecaprenyl-diphosphatase